MTRRRGAGTLAAALVVVGLLPGCSGADDRVCPDDSGACATSPPSPVMPSGTAPSHSSGPLDPTPPAVTPPPPTLDPGAPTTPVPAPSGGLPVPIPSDPVD